ncbi:hypothetical protein GCM10022393_14700 [Aquimarina addita]|uniref:TonB C-terminal domain-containing protein n=1 Tax=Aquimarina addita TaxID=870485 RepID=A0ABP7XFQ9_9FLAO
MKNTIILLTLTLVITYTQKINAQVTYPDCEKAKDLNKCYDNKILAFTDSLLTKTIKEKIIRFSKKDTIQIYSRINFLKTGEATKSLSEFTISIDSIDHSELDYLIGKLPIVSPALNYDDEPMDYTMRAPINFKIDRLTQELVPIKEHETIEYEKSPAKIVVNDPDQFPIYEGCDNNLTLIEAKKCVQTIISKHIGDNFNMQILNDNGIPSSKVFILFKVNKEGEIIDFKSRGPHPALDIEITRVIKLLPKFIKPAMKDGEAVSVPFGMAVNLQLN